MTLITADPPAPRPARPATVTVAFWLQLAAVLLLIALAGLIAASAISFDMRVDRAVALVPDADPAEVSAERASDVVIAAVTGGLVLLVAGWLAATMLPVPWEESRFLEALYGTSTPAEDAFLAAQAATSVIEVLLVVTIVVLVAVPPANRYFVPRPAPVWPPPYAAYPALPYVICPDPSIHVRPDGPE